MNLGTYLEIIKKEHWARGGQEFEMPRNLQDDEEDEEETIEENVKRVVMSSLDKKQYKQALPTVKKLMTALNDGKFKRNFITDFTGDPESISISDKDAELITLLKKKYYLTNEIYKLGIIKKKKEDKKDLRIIDIIKQLRNKDLEKMKIAAEKLKAKGKDPKKILADINYTKEIVDLIESEHWVPAYRHAPDKQHRLVFSIEPRKIASLSTCVGWTSCMNLGSGAYRDVVGRGIGEGILIVWITKPGDEGVLNSPSGRLLLKPYKPEGDKSFENIIWMADKVYGTAPKLFQKNVQRIIDKKWNNKKKQGIYRYATEMYRDDLDSTINKLLPETQEYIDKGDFEDLNTKSWDIQKLIVGKSSRNVKFLKNLTFKQLGDLYENVSRYIVEYLDLKPEVWKDFINKYPDAIDEMTKGQLKEEYIIAAFRSKKAKNSTWEILNAIKRFGESEKLITELVMLDANMVSEFKDIPEALQLWVVQNNLWAVIKIQRPTSKVVRAAIKEDSDLLVNFLRNGVRVPFDILSAKVKERPSILNFIDEDDLYIPHWKLQVEIVKEEPTAISDFDYSHPMVQIAALEKDISVYKLIGRTPSKEAQMYVARNKPELLMTRSMSYDNKINIAAYKLGIDKLGPKVLRQVDIDNPEKLVEYAVDTHPDKIDDMPRGMLSSLGNTRLIKMIKENPKIYFTLTNWGKNQEIIKAFIKVADKEGIKRFIESGDLSDAYVINIIEKDANLFESLPNRWKDNRKYLLKYIKGMKDPLKTAKTIEPFAAKQFGLISTFETHFGVDYEDAIKGKIVKMDEKTTSKRWASEAKLSEAYEFAISKLADISYETEHVSEQKAFYIEPPTRRIQDARDRLKKKFPKLSITTKWHSPKRDYVVWVSTNKPEMPSDPFGGFKDFVYNRYSSRYRSELKDGMFALTPGDSDTLKAMLQFAQEHYGVPIKEVSGFEIGSRHSRVLVFWDPKKHKEFKSTPNLKIIENFVDRNLSNDTHWADDRTALVIEFLRHNTKEVLAKLKKAFPTGYIFEWVEDGMTGQPELKVTLKDQVRGGQQASARTGEERINEVREYVIDNVFGTERIRGSKVHDVGSDEIHIVPNNVDSINIMHEELSRNFQDLNVEIENAAQYGSIRMVAVRL